MLDSILVDPSPRTGLLAVLAAAFACTLLVGPFANGARRIGLVDRPSGRKRHEGEVPLVGGLAIYVALVAVVTALGATPVTASVLLLGGVVVLLGAFDDLADAGAATRFMMQVLICLLLVSSASYQVHHFGDLVGLGPVSVTFVPLAMVLTALCLVGVMNAVNMVDGVDGLCGSVCAISLGTLGAIAWKGGATEEAIVCLAATGALLGFLAFNCGLFGAGRRVFLGDAGSVFLGLLIGALLVRLSQGGGVDGEAPVVRTVAAGWIVGLPIMDTVAVMVMRLVRGRSAFEAGRDHLHHVLQRRGLCKVRTVLLLLCVHGSMVMIGLVGETLRAPVWFMFLLFVGVTALHSLVIGMHALADRESPLSPRVAGRLRALLVPGPAFAAPRTPFGQLVLDVRRRLDDELG